jgi:hypothetical protein
MTTRYINLNVQTNSTVNFLAAVVLFLSISFCNIIFVNLAIFIQVVLSVQFMPSSYNVYILLFPANE